MAILKYIFYVATLPTVLHIPICDRDLSHLNYKKQIDISIACSVNESGGNHSEEYFKGLYEEK